jgi:hypothetical protein
MTDILEFCKGIDEVCAQLCECCIASAECSKGFEAEIKEIKDKCAVLKFFPQFARCKQ